ncbi:hypothetical protein F5B21DRAFT_364515 [Xylaria acuta]|nr:hypothetical protein F5B21DRAFT_364515 [Xylaria acuta]
MREWDLFHHKEISRCYLQIHFRCFAGIESLEKSPGTDGLRCDRERGQIASDHSGTTTFFFEERRISVFGLLSTNGQYPTTSKSLPAFYSVLILGDFMFSPDASWDSEWRAGLEGTIAFHAAVFASVSLWQTKWNEVLYQIDERIHARLEDTLNLEKINMCMFDNDFERSKLYVTILQVLRIFSEFIGTVSDDLRLLDDLFLKNDNFPMPDMRPDELRIMRSNWESVKEFQKQTEERLLGRISQKMEEVKSLRDGLFNATSLREANLSSREAQRSALIGRCVLIFTVVTVLYLPPSFISTVLDMDIFENEVDFAQTTWEYKVTVVPLSLVTYLLAFASIIAVD